MNVKLKYSFNLYKFDLKMRERGGTGKTVSFRVNKEFYERFKAIARALGYSPTEAIREAMRRFVKEGEKEVVKT